MDERMSKNKMIRDGDNTMVEIIKQAVQNILEWQCKASDLSRGDSLEVYTQAGKIQTGDTGSKTQQQGGKSWMTQGIVIINPQEITQGFRNTCSTSSPLKIHKLNFSLGISWHKSKGVTRAWSQRMILAHCSQRPTKPDLKICKRMINNYTKEANLH
ncbi:hypothetical protein Y1Q_0014641 [Alligator mississippiensis]|uniref:Uncharacterized protein n=1 Tax=Alligator mississippiensis TaxID=8496 RepID=A0A151P818_ALLMI|nr:hypothetical protein Y1Q_0014641 [Alligator mississippiensis]